MSTGRPNTSSKRKKSTPKKFKSKKLFASSGNDLLEEPEEPEISTCTEESKQERQLSPSKLPTTPQDKENVPAKYTYGSATVPRGRGRPKGSKNKTFPSSPTRVYSVREVKSPVYHSKTVIRSDSTSQNRAGTPHRGRGRPKGSAKVKPVVPDGPKRSRGRPKGSKNKKPSKATLLKMITSGQKIVKIGRGRPRKNPETSSESLTPKRGRGRPKGSLNKLTYARRVEFIEAHIEEEVAEEQEKEEEEVTDNDDNY